MTPDELEARSTRAVESLDLAERVLPGLLSTLTLLARWKRQALTAGGADPADFTAERMVGHPERWEEYDQVMARGRRVLRRRGNPLDRLDAWPPYVWEPGDLTPP